MIDSQSGTVAIPDSQTTEQAPQEVHRNRLEKSAASPFSTMGVPVKRERILACGATSLLQSAIRSIAPSG